MINRCARTVRAAALPGQRRPSIRERSTLVSSARRSAGLHVPPALHVLPWMGLLAALALAACAGGMDTVPESRAQRAEPARSASDGEVLGANRQSPQDTLEGSLTNEHAAPSHEGPAAEAHQRLDTEECIENDGRIPTEAVDAPGADAPAAGAPAAGAQPAAAQPARRRVCPKLESERSEE
jgi:hypothetical protein